MFIKDIKELNEKVVKETSKEVFLNMDEFFDKFYKGRDEIALLLITPKQVVAAHADRRINHGDLYSRMAEMMYDNDDFSPVIQIKCASVSYCDAIKSDGPKLMIPYICDLDSVNTDLERIKGITAKEKKVLDTLKKVESKNELDFIGCFDELLTELKVVDDDKLNGYEEKIIGCPFKPGKIRNDSEKDCKDGKDFSDFLDL